MTSVMSLVTWNDVLEANLASDVRIIKFLLQVMKIFTSALYTKCVCVCVCVHLFSTIILGEAQDPRGLLTVTSEGSNVLDLGPTSH